MTDFDIEPRDLKKLGFTLTPHEHYDSWKLRKKDEEVIELQISGKGIIGYIVSSYFDLNSYCGSRTGRTTTKFIPSSIEDIEILARLFTA